MLNKVIKKYEKDLDAVNSLLVASLSDENIYICKLVNNCLESRGKQLRPLITLILADNFSSLSKKEVYELASIYEQVHIASLIHDDVVDHCSQRRKRNTLNKDFGDEVAVLLGDYVFANIFSCSAKYGEQFVKAVADTISCLVKGELKQQEKVFDEQTFDSYLQVITYKTSSLLELVFAQTLKQLGKDDLVDSARKLARTFGQMFQIVDDWSDFCLQSQGKNSGSDVKNGFVTLPGILLYQKANKEEKENIIKLWNSGEESYFSSSFIQDMFIKFDLTELMRHELFKLYSSTQEALAELSTQMDINSLQCLVDASIKKFENINLNL